MKKKKGVLNESKKTKINKDSNRTKKQQQHEFINMSLLTAVYFDCFRISMLHKGANTRERKKIN